ncbi:hypothetical protein SD70_26360 [Gordoniibacillus kamchatkensis]|uniref:Uncharacterized protein n=1 Tax=Gordoniibacillus kamchatkensis TaxID=1590651 RepID=A0ABR5AC10_9BACL|nr:hypothetical protein SD70_26360 [Paenibacillus sp. VKM B-2647]
MHLVPLAFAPAHDVPVFVPNNWNSRVVGVNPHHGDGRLHKRIERKKAKQSIQKRRHAVAVSPHEPSGAACRRKIAIAEHKLVAMPHLHHNFQQLRGEHARDSLQHIGASFLVGE